MAYIYIINMNFNQFNQQYLSRMSSLNLVYCLTILVKSHLVHSIYGIDMGRYYMESIAILMQ